MALAVKEFQEELNKIRHFSQEELRVALLDVQSDFEKTKRLMSSTAKALSRLRARKLAIESKLTQKEVA